MLIYLHRGILPWQINCQSGIDKKTYIKNQKINILNDNGDIESIFLEYLYYIHSLGFDSNPNYDHLIDLLENKLGAI